MLNRFSIGIHGSARTTGWGKTMAAINLAIVYAKVQKALGQNQDKRFLLVTNTVEAAKHVNFAADKVMIWLLDEFEPGDSEQQQHLSNNMLKILLTQAPQGTLRCKGTETLAVPAGLPRLFTSNCATGEEWCRGRFEWEAPMRRKHIFCVVTEPLVNQIDGAVQEADAADEASDVRVTSETQRILSEAGL